MGLIRSVPKTLFTLPTIFDEDDDGIKGSSPFENPDLDIYFFVR
jgi:hypothetical protein